MSRNKAPNKQYYIYSSMGLASRECHHLIVGVKQTHQAKDKLMWQIIYYSTDHDLKKASSLFDRDP